MNIFKDFTLKWWQGALFKWGIFLLGLSAGAYWPVFFAPYICPMLAIAVVFLAYITYIWVKQ